MAGGVISAENAWGYDPYREGLCAFCAETGIQACESAEEAISHADTVLIAVKPYVIEGVLADIKDAARTLWPPLKKAVGRVRRGIRIAPLSFSLTLGGQEEPDKTAELYGYLHS